jgi:hypothetical protein
MSLATRHGEQAAAAAVSAAPGKMHAHAPMLHQTEPALNGTVVHAVCC